MGANTSALLSEEIDEISRQTDLPRQEVKRLYKRFQKLDRTQSGTLDADDLLMIPELSMNPLHPRLLAVFENLNFQQFVNNIAAFSPSGAHQKKLDFAFRVYDVDQDGFISPHDLHTVIRMLVGEHVPEDTVDEVVEKVVGDADLDKDGRISRDEFTSAVDVADLTSKLTVTF